MRHHLLRLLAAIALIPSAFALQSENLNLMIPRSPTPKVIDGKIDDWALQTGVFCCRNVLTMREKYASWLYASYDEQYLYIMSKWIDGSPMNNPGSVAGDYGFRGDSLQFRIVTQIDKPKEARTAHLMGWRDRNGVDVIDLVYGQKFDEGAIPDAKQQGALQAFLAHEDRSGYVQEMAIPWTLLTKDGYVPQAGDSILITFEPNFFTEAGFRLSTKDVFKPGVVIDRVFTFKGPTSWGYGKLIDEAPAEPRPLRLANMRELPVQMEDGKPVIDWSPLYEREEQPGVVPISFTMENDGYVSLNIFNQGGQVVRQLLTNAFFTKGEHTITWDGLTTPKDKLPGEIVETGTYRWKALTHKGIGLTLVGWAENAGSAPFDSPGGNWGGDHGKPCAVATAGKQVFLGWSGAEAGKAVVCTNLDGKVIWRHKHGGIGGAEHLAVADGIVYVNNIGGSYNMVYRIDEAKGNYAPWNNGASPATAVLDLQEQLAPFAPPMAEKDLPTDKRGKPKQRIHRSTGLAVAKGIMLVAYGEGDRILSFDADTGAKLADCALAAPGDMEFGPDGRCYVISKGSQVVALSPDLSNATVIVDGLEQARGIALDTQGQIYVGVDKPRNQVLVFDAQGTQTRTIGRDGGRPLLGPWQADGLRFINALAIDSAGKLWIAEEDDKPKRISRWDAASGTLEAEFFGPTHYGATGGAISPTDPRMMAGDGCEWQLDPETGKGRCIGVISRGHFSTVRFGQSPDGRLYLATGAEYHGLHPVAIYERIAAGDWKLRSELSPILETPEGKNKRPDLVGMRAWADRNDDQQQQDDEVVSYRKDLVGWISGWYSTMSQDLAFSGGVYHIAPVGYTDCGAPIYDLDQATPLPHPDDVAKRGGMGMQRGHSSDNGDLVIYNGHYGKPHSDFVCYDVKSGQLVWSYPNTYVGIHGGHRAPPGQPGLIRAAYGPVGTATLPAPLGHIFVIATDKGEWHILNEEGFYISHLFESDRSRIQWPNPVKPGAMMDTVPVGMGAEDFGGSMILANDGQLYMQHGKTAFINSQVTGLDQVRVLASGDIELPASVMDEVAAIRTTLLQNMVGVKKTSAAKQTITFTGDITKDFGKMAVMEFAKSPASKVKAAIAYDDTNIYLGYEVQDQTPWVNGAKNPERMYAAGDTVDFQLACDPTANPERREAGPGDLRLSIGNFQGTPTAVIYRRRSEKKQPMSFVSGVVTDGYVMDYVAVVPEAHIEVKVNNNGYTVEVVLPQAAIDVELSSELALNGDFGATHGDKPGDDTVLRTHWNNQATGLVADEVFELKMAPANWGQINFE